MSSRINTYIYILLISCIPLFSQSDDDSLLKQISNIDIELNTPVEAEENLYLNTVSFQSFYDVLSPMGEWIQVTKEDVNEDLEEGSGQGYSSAADDEPLLFIWKPANVNSDWKPYINGRWIYTNHGWLWQSNDAWGNSTYNYGRWYNSRKYGWVWMPGYAWAPSWVRWKVSNDHIGWAPLTPKAKWQSDKGIAGSNYSYKEKDADWVFVQKESFPDEINASKTVSPGLNSDIIKKSESITDIKVENDVVTNNGPDVTDIEKRSGKKMQRRYLKFTKERNHFNYGDKDVVISREDFVKYKNGKGLNIDKPKKFRKSERVKKYLKKKFRQNKRKHLRLPPGK